ncbi:hypothetical protein AVEN_204802-1 [Araneus ventricosus]|uniref:Integrase catalytic domain-containing protein n=1 Tax=Araneus ventricosus TaxID=182803 RepID=A0A4Y2W8D9_ARAVE|nr:hypothetical protein AVEN_204802-1 [Araneus ventricosus]
MDEKLGNLRDTSLKLAEKLTELKHLDSQIETDTSVDEPEDEIIQSQEYQEKGKEISAPFPPDRIEKSQPFEVSEIEFAGPLILRDGSKVYIALFTCAVSQGIHVELIPSLSAECFIQAFLRFISRRAVCKIIYSDNAKTFKRVDKELKYLCKNENVSRFIVRNGITWKFIVEGAPWWGGFWKRLVRSVKTCLKRILGKSSLTYEELYTVLVEIEVVINSRLITYLYSNANEPDPLSLSHFLTGSKLIVLPSPNAVPKSSKSDLIKRWKQIIIVRPFFGKCCIKSIFWN